MWYIYIYMRTLIHLSIQKMVIKNTNIILNRSTAFTNSEFESLEELNCDLKKWPIFPINNFLGPNFG